MTVRSEPSTATTPHLKADPIAEKARAFFDRHLGIIFLMPGVGLILLILSYPIVSNIFLSFTNKHLIYRDTRVVGLENYGFTLGDADFYVAFLNTVVWTAASISLQVVVGFAVALLLNLPLPGRRFFRLAVIVPYAFPPVTVALIWKWLLHSLYGVINFFFVDIGFIEKPIPWLSQGFTSMSSLIVVNVWFGFPLFSLAILAGLQSIPQEHYEVAKIEGARPLQTLWYVTVPSVLRIVGIIIVLRTIWVFNTFDLIFVMTGGGPAGATETLPVYAYRVGWQQGFIGQTASISVLLFGVLAGMIWFYFRVFKIEQEQ